jgi:hypothetical protein
MLHPADHAVRNSCALRNRIHGKAQSFTLLPEEAND